MESQSNGGKYKKKKKMSYMQKMKKFGKSGRFGQGRQVDKETYDYFLRVMEANRDQLYKNWSSGKTGVQFTWPKNRLKNRLRIRLRLNFDSITCLNYPFLDFFQYRKSQADSHVVSRAVFQAVIQANFWPCELNPSFPRRPIL